MPKITLGVLLTGLFFLTHVHVHAFHTSNSKNNKLLLILVDGCRWDYPDEDPLLKGFKRLADNGVRAPYTIPIFPTNSYPNWYTIVTGLYAESHGFVNNMMYDQEYNDFFLMAPNETAAVARWWNYAEPIWVTAEKRGKKSALFWWDGCQVEIRNHKPSYCRPYKYVGSSWPTVDSDTEEALKTSLKLLENDEIQLAQVYYEPVDYNGHKFGPDSEERKEAVRKIDSLLYYLQTEMEESGLDDSVNVVVVSDHGMISTDRKNLNLINLQQEVDVDSIRYMIYYGASSMILPYEGHEERLYSQLKNIRGLSVYRKDEIPDRFHLKNNRLTLPLLLIASKNYYMMGLDIPGKSIPTGSSISLGSHGYDAYEAPEMRGIFFARGPSFKKRHISQPLEIVDFYGILCDALGIEPLSNNGSISRTRSIFETNRSASMNRTYQLHFGILYFSLFIITLVIGNCVLFTL